MTGSTTKTSPPRRKPTAEDITRCILVTAASGPAAWLCAALLSHRTLGSHEQIGTIVFTVLLLGNALRYSIRSWAWSGIFLSGLLLFPAVLDRRCLLLASLAIPILTAVALDRWATWHRVFVVAVSLASGALAVLGASALLARWPGSVEKFVSAAWDVQWSMWGEQRQLSRAREEWEIAIDSVDVNKLSEQAKRELEAIKAMAQEARRKEQGDYLQEAITLYRRAVGQLLTVDLGGGVTMKFVPIRAGEFLMGSPAGEAGHYADETQHKVKLTKPFCMQTTPVTQAQWKAVMGSDPSNFKGDDLPVESVTWNDAVDFCRRLGEKDGKHYRLPTEAEWEYACRAGTTTRFYTGDDDQSLDRAGWYSVNSGGKTHPVGQKDPNAFGLYDMHGNVWQWCSDVYEANYPAGPVSDPTGPAQDPNARRVLRGGSWDGSSVICRSALRNWLAPDFRSYIIGFRVVLDSP